MLHPRCLLVLALGCAPGFLVSVAQAQTQACPQTSCNYTCSISNSPSPISLSASKHYFSYKGSPIALVGQTPEYLCHIAQPQRDGQFCTLANDLQRFTEMQARGNNVIRLEAIFDHSPGFHSRCNTATDLTQCPGAPAKTCCGAPFSHEQPFCFDPSTQKWSLNRPAAPGSQVLVADLDQQYLCNLEKVLCDAYQKDIIVEVSLFNVWDGDWTKGPFNRANTLLLNGKPQGFSGQNLFMTLASGDAQDNDARNAQKGAVAAIVNRLKKFPNLIWEVANEPDAWQLSSAKPDVVFPWQQAMIDEIVKWDTTHLIELEGFTAPTFGWKDGRVSIETAHYVQETPASGFYGAIDLLRGLNSGAISPSHPVAVGFNENVEVPGPARTMDDGRSEAWEFALAGGALFDGYTTDYSKADARSLSVQLGQISTFLLPQQEGAGIRFLDDARPASCNGDTDWCSGLKSWGASDRGTCCPTQEACPVIPNIYWSALKAEGNHGTAINDYGLYIHHGTVTNLAGSNFRQTGYHAIPCGDGQTSGYQTTGLKLKVKTNGCYRERWIDPATGLVKSGWLYDMVAGQTYTAKGSPFYTQDILVFLSRVGTGSCFADPPLTASFTFTCDYLWCTFDASGSSPSSVISTYTWDWGNGTFTSSGDPTQLHVFPDPGSRDVTLTVTDLSNDVGSTTQTVSAEGQPPTPIFSASCNSLTCNFYGGNSRGGSGSIVGYSWSFGDGTGGTGVAPTHPYAVGDNYPVTLIVTDMFGIPASLTQMVPVAGPPPNASFLFLCSGLTCNFDASGTTGGNPISSYSWSFGDGTSGSGISTSHTYAAKGTYSVTLTATDTISRQSAFLKILTVTSDPSLPAESYFALPPCRVLDTRTPPWSALNDGQTIIVPVANKCGIPSNAKAVSFNVTAVSPTRSGSLSLFPGDQTALVSTVSFDPARSPRVNNTIQQLATNSTGTIGVRASLPGSGQVHLVLDIDGYFSEDTAPAPGAQGPLGYQTITPCRIADTRTTGTPLVSSTLRTFSIQGSCGIPAGAVTAALNVTIVAPTNLGFLVLYPSSQGVPAASDMNWVTGTTALANGARPMLAATTPDLAVWPYLVASGNTSHLVIDTMGYFKNGAPYKFHPITPCRAVDTTVAGAGAPAIGAGTLRSFQIQGNCGVPVGAKAAFISTNLLASGTTTGGLLLLFPSGGSSNGTSFMNFDAGEPAMAGGAIVQLSTSNADISVASSSNVDLIIKVLGYFD
jgi:PKD repeat protein